MNHISSVKNRCMWREARAQVDSAVADRPASLSSAESGGPHKPGGQAGGGQLATFCLKGVLYMSLGSQIFLYYSGILHQIIYFSLHLQCEIIERNKRSLPNITIL